MGKPLLYVIGPARLRLALEMTAKAYQECRDVGHDHARAIEMATGVVMDLCEKTLWSVQRWSDKR
jgi:hypothetical protein